MSEQRPSSVEVRDDLGEYLAKIGRTPLLNAEQEVELSQQIEVGQMAGKIRDGTFEYKIARDNDPESRKKLMALNVTPEELEWLDENGAEAKDKMIKANLRLVVSLARRRGHQLTNSMQLIDVIQEGNIGLNRAVEKFDYEKGFKFSTYATWWIRQAMTRGIADQSRIVRIPVHMDEIVNKINRIQRTMTQDLDREPTLEELAVEVKLSPKKVQETLDYAKKPTSLNRPLGDDGAGELGDLVANTLPESQAYIAFHETQKALNDLLDEVLGGLKDTRIVDVIKMRYGLFDGNVWLLDQVGEYFGCTREWARQLEKKGRDRLEAHVKAKGLSFSDFMD